MKINHALDAAALALASVGPAMHKPALTVGINNSQWVQARVIACHAPHLAAAVAARTMPLGQAAALARITRIDPAAGRRAERAMTGDRYRDSAMLRTAQYQASSAALAASRATRETGNRPRGAPVAP